MPYRTRFYVMSKNISFSKKRDGKLTEKAFNLKQTEYVLANMAIFSDQQTICSVFGSREET